MLDGDSTVLPWTGRRCEASPAPHRTAPHPPYFRLRASYGLYGLYSTGCTVPYRTVCVLCTVYCMYDVKRVLSDPTQPKLLVAPPEPGGVTRARASILPGPSGFRCEEGGMCQAQQDGCRGRRNWNWLWWMGGGCVCGGGGCCCCCY